MVEDFISYDDVSQQSTGIKNFSMMFRAHCLKSVQIRSYFWSVFSCIRTEYGDLRRSEYKKIRTRNNTVFGHFSCSV